MRWKMMIVGFLMIATIGAAQRQNRRKGGDNPWGYHPAEIKDPALPRVLLIGDSISIGYYKVVVRELAGKANVDLWATGQHQGDSSLFTQVAEIIKQHGPYAAIHFNTGLHGYQKGRIPEGQYIPLTRKLVRTIRESAPGAKLIWASITPVTVKGQPEKLDPEINPVIVQHNAMATQIMKEEKVPIDDLSKLMSDKLNLMRGDSFHWTQPGYDIIGKSVAQSVLDQLGAKAGK